jgi:hypothetical protein
MGNTSFDVEFKNARRAATVADQTEPRARSARYDARADRIIVELRNGASFIFPPALAQGLSGASTKDLSNIRITPSGAGLRWPNLDAGFSLPVLMSGIFGNRSWMAQLGRKGGQVRSEAKTAAARANGLKGGRPPKKSIETPRPRIRSAAKKGAPQRRKTGAS